MVMTHTILLACLVFASASEVKVNPMRKIINMLQDMQEELEREGKAELELFEKAMCACSGGEKELTNTIASSTSEIDSSKTKIGSDTAELTQMEQEIGDHKTAIETCTSDLATATELRAKEEKTFTETSKGMKMNIHQLSKAIPALESGLSGSAFLQVMTPAGSSRLRRVVGVTRYLSDDERQQVLSFLDQGTGEELGEAIQAPGTEQILGMLKTMKEEMSKDLAETTSEEESAKQDFSSLEKAKKAELDVNEKAVITKDKRIGELKLSISEASHALEDAEEELANAEKFLSSMKEQCASMEKNKAMRQKMRNDEIAAISEAIKILNDDDALEVFSKAKSASLVQKRTTYDAFLQVGSTRSTKRASSRSMLKLVSAHRAVEEPAAEEVDPMAEAEKMVTGMIGGMIKNLHEEDVDEEIKKIWCANETKVNEALKASKTTEEEQLTASMEEMEDSISTLAEEIKGLGESIQAIDKEVHELTVERKAEHQEFVDSLSTSATALRLIDKAIVRLEKFYSPEAHAKKAAAAKEAALKKAGLALLSKSSTNPNTLAIRREEERLGGSDFDSFLQTSSKVTLRIRESDAVAQTVSPVNLPEVPGAYVKKESGGVIGLMNEFKTEMKTEMTEAEVEEKHAAEDYVRIMEDAKMSRSQDVKSLNDKKRAKAQLDESFVDAKGRKAMLEAELHNLELYLVTVHHDCDVLLANFEANHEARIAKELGLKQTESMITKNDPPGFQAVKAQYDAEKTVEDVEANFPPTFL